MKVLFVCLGNICRSPLGEGILRHLLDQAGLAGQIAIDSAGTGGWHIGEPPDARSIAVATRHGVSLAGQRARQVRPTDFSEFDLILAMDRQNLADLHRQCPAAARGRLRLLRSFDPEAGDDVPDPYHDGDAGFEHVFAMIRRCCEVLVRSLPQQQSV